MIKKEIKNAKQADDVEDEIHDIKKDVSGSANNPDAADPASNNAVPATTPTPAPATTPPAGRCRRRNDSSC